MAEIDSMKKSSTDETPGKKCEPTAKDLILITPLNVPVATPYKNNRNDKQDKNNEK